MNFPFGGLSKVVLSLIVDVVNSFTPKAPPIDKKNCLAFFKSQDHYLLFHKMPITWDKQKLRQVEIWAIKVTSDGTGLSGLVIGPFIPKPAVIDQ